MFLILKLHGYLPTVIAASIIIIHTHSSGDPPPGPDDTAMSRAILQVGKLFDVPALDHLSIGRDKHVSLEERRVEFN
jgi:DNA repair protein RadC